MPAVGFLVLSDFLCIQHRGLQDVFPASPAEHPVPRGTGARTAQPRCIARNFPVRKSPCPKPLRRWRCYLGPAWKWVTLASLILQGTSNIPFHSTILSWKGATSSGILRCPVNFIHLIVLYLNFSCWTPFSLFSLCLSLPNTFVFHRSWSFFLEVSLFLFLSAWDAHHDVQVGFWSQGVPRNEINLTLQQHCPLLVIFKRSKNKNYLPFNKMSSWVSWK